MKLWEKLTNQEWINTSGKRISYSSTPKSIMTESNGQVVIVPLSVLRSLLEDNGYESHRMGTLQALQDKLDQAIDINGEVNWEAMVAKGTAYQRQILIGKLSEEIQQAEGEMDTLIKFRNEVLKFAQELVDRSATLPSNVIGEYMKKRFK